MPGKGRVLKVTLDRKVCISCNLCVEVAPEVFHTKGEKSAVRPDADLTSNDNQEKARLAEQACPVKAIGIVE